MAVQPISVHNVDSTPQTEKLGALTEREQLVQEIAPEPSPSKADHDQTTPFNLWTVA